MVRQFFEHDIDYLTNSVPPTYPDGLDLEIFNRESLLWQIPNALIYSA